MSCDICDNDSAGDDLANLSDNPFNTGEGLVIIIHIINIIINM